MKRKLMFEAIATAVLISSIPAIPVLAAEPSCRDIDPLQYTYEIYPLAEPFNEYFYIKTDNPHPESFRFSDKDSPYSESSVIYNVDTIYADVEYENPDLYRVNGGYIFRSFTTNGGEVTLQVQEPITEAEFNTAIYGTPEPEFSGYSPWHGMPVGSYDQHYEGSASYSILGYYKWADTDITLTLPELCDDCDYLIQTYATKDDFFSNMDAVQAGFSSICLYSGSYIRGELYRYEDSDWRLTPGFHVDQSFYIYSPYGRKDNKSLFASTLYPYRYDSLGFPGMMGNVSKRLSSDSSYEWSSINHSSIEVTYNGTTKSYGGQGHGEGQGLSEDKLTHIFHFADNDESMTLSESKALLDEYAAAEMEDDIPREDALTWEKIYNTVGDGAWVDMGGNYTYLYQKDSKASFSSDEWGVGNSIYWGGSLGYCRDTWVDGRYISKTFVKGASFEEYPESSVMMTSVVMPEIISVEKTWDSSAKKYICTNVEISEGEQKNILFKYDSSSKTWKPAASWGEHSTSYSTFQTLTEQGVIDEKYLDMLTLTQEEVMAVINNGNTDKKPESCYIFDGNSPQGTYFCNGDVNADGAFNVSDVILLQKWLLAVPNTHLANWKAADFCEDEKLNVFDLCLMKRELLNSK